MISVDPGGLVPTGPFRWTIVTVTIGVVVLALAATLVMVLDATAG